MYETETALNARPAALRHARDNRRLSVSVVVKACIKEHIICTHGEVGSNIFLYLRGYSFDELMLNWLWVIIVEGYS